MPSPANVIATSDRVGVLFAEAVEFLRRRLAIGSDEWMRILAEEGITATAIADDLVRSVVEDLALAALEVMETGGTIDDFRQHYARIVKERGWSYHGNEEWHSRLVYRLHIGQAQEAGRWEQATRLQEQNPQTTVYARYVTAGDHRVRPVHREWDGITLPLDHPFWQTHWPPNGFNCRCHARVLTETTMRRRGYQVTPDDDPRLQLPADKGWTFNPGLAGNRLRQLERAQG